MARAPGLGPGDRRFESCHSESDNAWNRGSKLEALVLNEVIECELLRGSKLSLRNMM